MILQTVSDFNGHTMKQIFLEYLLPQQQGTPLTTWDVFRSKVTSKGVSLKQISVEEDCHTKAIGCVEFSCHPMLSCYPMILIQTLFPHSAYIVNLLERELPIYHDTAVQDDIAKPTSVNVIPCPLKCHVDDHVPVLFSCISLMLMHFCLTLISCNSWQMDWMHAVPLGCMPPALPTQQLEQSLWGQDFVPRSC